VTASATSDRAVNLVVTNFSGGKRHAGRGAMDGDALQGMARLADSVRTEGGFVLAVQEMTTDDPAMPTHAAAFEEALTLGARSSLVPRVSAAWYPLKEKWGEKIAPGGAHNEGLCVVTGDAGLALVPWSSAPWPTIAGPVSVMSPTRILDLPNLSFPDTESGLSADDGWLQASVVINGTSEQVAYRPAFYRGTRDSDPRVAQACLLAWLEAEGPNAHSAACVLINVHLSTLTTELQAGVRGRIPTPEAIFLRRIQLDLIALYVREIQAETAGIPVVVAGDFNAEPGSPEMLAFAERTGSAPLLDAQRCWKCGTIQAERPEILFYAHTKGGWDFTIHPQSADQEPELRTRAVCSNEECLEPRFTHKGHGQLLDNVFILPAGNDYSWEITPGAPRVDVGWAYSDHAAIIVPLKFTGRTLRSPEVRVGNAAQVRD
jgi:Endonuclease/Exonuclease/phosphatase family